MCASYGNAQIDPGSIEGVWLFDEGSGTIAKDSSGHGYDADLRENPMWVQGKRGHALKFQGGSYLEIRNSAENLAFGGAEPFSITAWVKNQGGGTLIGKFNGGIIGAYILVIGGGGTVQFHRETAPWSFSGSKTLPNNDFGHVAVTYDGTDMKIYVNGEFDTLQARGPQNTDTVTPVFIGARMTGGAPSNFLSGVLDEVALFNVALTEEQIRAVMSGLTSSKAGSPIPEDETIDVPRDTSLGWTGTDTAATHNVYFGMNWDDVNAASPDAPLGVQISEGQTETTYTPETVLAYGESYFWRIDEVNGAPDHTVFKGNIWSFTVEPFSIPIAGITATTASSFGISVAENTINGSGLAGDLHGTSAGDMWISGGIPATIDYAFDRAYKLHELWIWNSNQLIEAFVGFGAKDVVIEHSLDGENWTVLDGVGPLAQAPGLEGYAHNNTIGFGGITAQYVRIAINSVHGIAPQASL
ncbi:MAG: hypothetical protein IIA65_10480, partial [Planctomycetes bacterium]|nr:hypothetical protein [Planctomycetota bacterium]